MGRRFLGEAKKVKLQLYATPEDVATVNDIAQGKGLRVGEVTGKLFHLGVKRYQQLKEEQKDGKKQGISNSGRGTLREGRPRKHRGEFVSKPNGSLALGVGASVSERTSKGKRSTRNAERGTDIRVQDIDDIED
jgi:hypothetical protein